VSLSAGTSGALRTVAVWSVVAAVAAIVSLAAAFAPLRTVAAGVSVSLAAAALVRFGALGGIWMLVFFTLPLREPLGYDILGTRTLYATDVLVLLAAGVAALRHGVRGVWLQSPTLRLGVAIVAWSSLGLYLRSNLMEIAAIHRLLGQIALVFVAGHAVRSAADAERTIVAFLAGLAIAVLYGYHQAATPIVGASFPSWAKVPVAYDAAGVPHVRVFSTYDHTLHFSQALSMGVGMGAALLLARTSAARRVFGAAVAGGAAICNLLTYSVSGIAGMATAAVALVWGSGRRRLVMFLPVLAAVTLLVAPNALYQRIEHIASGRSISSVVRVLTYREGLKSFAEHPVLGVGWGGVPALRYDFVRQKGLPAAPENWVLHRAVAIGLPGLFLYLGVLAVFLKNWRRSRGLDPAWPRLAVGLGVVTYFAHAMFFPGESYSNNYLVWSLFAITEVMARERRAACLG
jgi:O-antigen ligase